MKFENEQHFWWLLVSVILFVGIFFFGTKNVILLFAFVHSAVSLQALLVVYVLRVKSKGFSKHCIWFNLLMTSFYLLNLTRIS